ncbi:hypothetical protein ALC57_07817, partial [Trachymyrmex cornetzi]
VLSGALVELLGSCSKKSSISAANKCLRDWFILFQYLWYNPLPPSPRGGTLDAEKLDKTSTWS